MFKLNNIYFNFFIIILLRIYVSLIVSGTTSIPINRLVSGTTSIPINRLVSGTTSIPINRPVCAFHKTQSGGKVCVLGSSHIFSDQYIDKEENSKLFDVIIDYLTSEKVSPSRL